MGGRSPGGTVVGPSGVLWASYAGLIGDHRHSGKSRRRVGGVLLSF